MGEKDKLSGDQVSEMGLADWRPILGALRARFRTGDFVSGLRFATAVTDAAEEMNHHPDVDLRYPYVDVSLSSHDVGGMTSRDVDLARRISEIAAGMDAAGEPAVVQQLELGIDTWDADEIGPFWAAVVGADYEDGQVVDPAGNVPTIWFQDTDQHEEPRQRFHVDHWVPVDQAASRIEAALAAGGRLVSDEHAPSFTVLADPQGNKACICTNAGRPVSVNVD